MITIGRGLSVFVGGARSGKSDLVVQLGRRWTGTVTFVATASAGDDDMADRIERHTLDRPDGWGLLEAPHFASSDLADIDDEALLIVDCITMLAANLMFDDRGESEVLEHVDRLGAGLAARTAPTLVVSNEVGLGVHPPTELGREYRDLLGRVNRVLADHADAALFVVAGRALPLHDIRPDW